MSNRLEVNTRSLKQAVRKVGDVAGERLQRGLDEVADGYLGKPHPEVLDALWANSSLQSVSPTSGSLDRWAAVISGGSRIQVSVRAG